MRLGNLHCQLCSCKQAVFCLSMFARFCHAKAYRSDVLPGPRCCTAYSGPRDHELHWPSTLPGHPSSSSANPLRLAASGPSVSAPQHSHAWQRPMLGPRRSMEAELPGQQAAVRLEQPQQSGASTGLNFTRAHSTGTPNDWGAMPPGRLLPEPGTSLATTLSRSLTHSYRETLVQGRPQGTGPQAQQQQQQPQPPPPPRHSRRASWAPSPNSQVGFAVGQPGPAAQQFATTVLQRGTPSRPNSAGPVAPAGLTAASSQQQSGPQPLPRVRFEDRVPFGSPFGASPSGQGALGAELALQQREAAAAVAVVGDRPAGGSDDEGSVIDRPLSEPRVRGQRRRASVADPAQAPPWDQQWAGSAPAQSSGIPASGVGAGQSARQQVDGSSVNAQPGPSASSRQASTRQPEAAPPQTSHASPDAADGPAALLAQQTGAGAGAANAPAAQHGEPSSRDRSTAAWVPVGSQDGGGGHGTLWSQPVPPEQASGPVALTAGAVRAAHAAAGGFQAAPAAVVPEVPPVQPPAAQLPAGELQGCLIKVCATPQPQGGLEDYCHVGRQAPRACVAQWHLQPMPGMVSGPVGQGPLLLLACPATCKRTGQSSCMLLDKRCRSMISPVPASHLVTWQQVCTRPVTGMLMPAGFGDTRQGAAVVAAAIRLAALPPSMVNLGWEYPAELLQGSDGALPEVPGDRSAGLHHEVSVGLGLAGWDAVGE